MKYDATTRAIMRWETQAQEAQAVVDAIGAEIDSHPGPGCQELNRLVGRFIRAKAQLEEVKRNIARVRDRRHPIGA